MQVSTEELLDLHAAAAYHAAQAADIPDFHLREAQAVLSPCKEFDERPAVHHLNVLLADMFLRKGDVDVLLIGKGVLDDPLTGRTQTIIGSRRRSPYFTYNTNRPNRDNLTGLEDGWSAIFAEYSGRAHFAVRRGCKAETYPGLAVVMEHIGSVLAVKVAAKPEVLGTVIARS